MQLSCTTHSPLARCAQPVHGLFARECSQLAQRFVCAQSQVKSRVTAKLREKLYADNLRVMAKFLDLSGASRL